MAEKPPSASTEPAPSNRKQNLFAGVVFGAVILLILLLAVVYLQMNGAGFSGSSDTAASAATKAPDSSDARKRARELSTRLGVDTTALVDMVADLSDRLAAAEEELEGTRALYTSAVRGRPGQLKKSAAQAGARAAEIARLRTQLAETRALLQVSEQKADALMAKVSTAPDPSALREAQALRDSAESELRQTQAMLVRDEAEKARLRALINSTTAEAVTAEAALDEANALFVSDSDALPEQAKQLFAELARLETVDPSGLEAHYQMLGATTGARVVDTVPFATGSATVDPAKAASIRAAIANGADNAFFLVVGYASKTGNFDLNKELSSARAAAVATLADADRKPGQAVRGIFLGQTDRFSASNVYDDQICDYWEIRL